MASCNPGDKPTRKYALCEEEWKGRLTAEQFRVCRLGGTERPFTGQHWRMDPAKTDGAYACACCKTPLFRAAKKFDSGTGWPSFFEAIPDRVAEHRSPGDGRVEVRCAACDAHLGHVFADGPPPSGLRYCVNGVGLDYRPK